MPDRRMDAVQRAAEDRLDSELLGRIARGDRQALAQLYDRYYHQLLRFIHRLTGDLGLILSTFDYITMRAEPEGLAAKLAG